MNTQTKTLPHRSTTEKIHLFRQYFRGLEHVYGTYDPVTGAARQLKQPVTDEIIYRHLKGVQPYGVYLLVHDRTHAIAVDFDHEDAGPPLEFVAHARHYSLPAYLERSKSKGYHVWLFFEEQGIIAAKARRVIHHILEEIEQSRIEVFPKQDSLNNRVSYGNFINAPLNGRLVPQGRTVFIDEKGSLEPYPNQWDLLESVERVPESVLDDIIELNDLAIPREIIPAPAQTTDDGRNHATYGLLPCARRVLERGVTENQRVTCFRLAIHLRKTGLPIDLAISTLTAWARKNRPNNGKGIITDREIVAQTQYAYDKDYRSYGCEEPTIAQHCDSACPIYAKIHRTQNS